MPTALSPSEALLLPKWHRPAKTTHEPPWADSRHSMRRVGRRSSPRSCETQYVNRPREPSHELCICDWIGDPLTHTDPPTRSTTQASSASRAQEVQRQYDIGQAFFAIPHGGAQGPAAAQVRPRQRQLLLRLPGAGREGRSGAPRPGTTPSRTTTPSSHAALITPARRATPSSSPTGPRPRPLRAGPRGAEVESTWSRAHTDFGSLTGSSGRRRTSWAGTSSGWSTP